MKNVNYYIFILFFTFISCSRLPSAFKKRNFLTQDCIFQQLQFSKSEQACIKMSELTMVCSLYEENSEQPLIGLWKVSYVCKNSDRCRQKIAKNLPTGFRYFFYDGKQFTFGNFFSQEIPNCFDSVAVNTQINNLKKQFLDVEIEIWNWISKDMNAKKYLDYNFQGRVF